MARAAAHDDPKPALLRALHRRLAYPLEGGGEGREAVLRSIALVAARSGASVLDAVLVDGVIHVAITAPEPAGLPERTERLDEGAAALGLKVRFVRGDAVAQPELDPDRRAREELMRAVRFHVARIASRWQGALDDEDAEEVHSLRGSLRRLRSALSMIGDDAFDPGLRELDRWARELSPLTGALRDLDVSIASLGAIAPDATSLAHARKLLLASRARARDAMLAHLHRAEVIATLRSAMSATPELDGPRGATRRAAGHAVERGLTRVERSLNGDLQRPEGYHCIRRRARRLRDLIDVAEGALGRADRAWRKRIHGLQVQLGDLHDVDVLTGLLAHGDRALDGLRGAVERRRTTLIAGIGPPLALLAVDLRER
jgi:CHAD domain-containing protein